MKKVWLGASALVAIGMVTPASAADLAARPYTKAPPMAAIYDWGGFYIGANGGWGSSRNCWDFTTPTGAFVAAEAVTMRPVAQPVVRSAIAGRPAPGCSASKRRATGLTSKAAM